jgi:hypothetical protein
MDRMNNPGKYQGLASIIVSNVHRWDTSQVEQCIEAWMAEHGPKVPSEVFVVMNRDARSPKGVYESYDDANANADRRAYRERVAEWVPYHPKCQQLEPPRHIEVGDKVRLRHDAITPGMTYTVDTIFTNAMGDIIVQCGDSTYLYETLELMT